MRTEDFDFYLPDSLIAQHPAEKRSESRLLCLDGNSGQLTDSMFVDLDSLLSPGEVIVFNDTRVMKARLFGRKHTGGAIECLVERILDSHDALAMIKASKPPKPGTRLIFEENLSAEVIGRNEDLFHLRFDCTDSVDKVLERYGQLPLPPYITHSPTAEDESRYQTVFAKHEGAVAAPTAGLHFDEPMLQKLKNKGIHIAYITLHVGAGTFKPVKVDNIEEHRMHSERYMIPDETVSLIEQARKNGKKITAVGTTVLRALESASQSGTLRSGPSETSIFITPGYRFIIADRLLTNFHLPKSTLMMLVSAFAGHKNIMHAYAHAVAQTYRFFSYGDAMLLERQTNELNP